jgi:hypothetical protein
MVAEICHGADALEQPAMEQTTLSPPWRCHLGAVRHGEGCLGTVMKQAALRSPWSGHLGAVRHGAGCLEVTLEPAAMELAARGLRP